MSTKAGKNALRTCLAKLDSSAKIDTLLCYKVGNKKCTADYQNNNAVAVLTQKESKRIHNGVPFIVKCFIHSEIYAGWHSDVGIGSGKYCIETSRLAEFEADTDCDFKEMVTGGKEMDRVYLFRKESGIKEFFENVVGLKEQENTK